MIDLKSLLDAHALEKNTDLGLYAASDPLQAARKFKEPHIALICALFAYGNANLILKFLNSLDFSLLDKDESDIVSNLQNFKYRFQNTQDVRQIFITISRLKKEGDMEAIIKKGFDKNGLMVEGINELIKFIYSLNSYKSDGYEFFFGKSFEDKPKSPYKRYNMFLRWMVRDSDIDLGLFKNLLKSELLIPLDVHTHRVSLALGLINRKSYDFTAVCELTDRLKEFDPIDPIRYDFALYRIGQSKELEKILNIAK